MANLPELLQTLVGLGGSDLHITTNTPPQVRVHGHLQRLDGSDMTPSDTKQLAYSVLTDAQKKRFEETKELDFSFGIKGIARFRCNMFNNKIPTSKSELPNRNQLVRTTRPQLLGVGSGWLGVDAVISPSRARPRRSS